MELSKDEIIYMAREAGAFRNYFDYAVEGFAFVDDETLERFAALVATHEREKHNSPSWETVDDAIAAEREACAKLFADEDCLFEGKHIAAAIRARGEK